MMTLLFMILFFSIFGKLAGFMFRATWSMVKVFFYLIFLPVIIIGLVIGGLIRIALPVLVIIGIIILFERA